jgi:hypothetical protein
MKDFFYAIQDLFVDYLFFPFDALRNIAYDSWFLSNIVSWILMAIGFAAFIYWMLQLKKFDASGEEDKSITSHSYL